MNIFNPTAFSTGFKGRSDAPRWRGKEFILKPGEIIFNLDAKCVNYLVNNYGQLGLVSYPDRNVVREDVEFKALIEKQTKVAIRKLFQHAKKTMDTFKDQYRNSVDSRIKRPKPCEYALLAEQIIEKYKDTTLILSPHEVAQMALMKKLEEENDSDKESDDLDDSNFQEEVENAEMQDKLIVLEDADKELEGNMEVEDGGNPSSDENSRQEFTT